LRHHRTAEAKVLKIIISSYKELRHHGTAGLSEAKVLLQKNNLKIIETSWDSRAERSKGPAAKNNVEKLRPHRTAG
jgi:hypothetical protein